MGVLAFLTAANEAFGRRFGCRVGGEYLGGARLGAGVDVRVERDNEFGNFIPEACVRVTDNGIARLELGDLAHDVD
jgi:hypothetical protein